MKADARDGGEACHTTAGRRAVIGIGTETALTCVLRCRAEPIEMFMYSN